jgi:ubiquinone/menaquinone biosynthesis C-methylase UbiE
MSLYRLLEIPLVYRLNTFLGRLTVDGYNRLLGRFVQAKPGMRILDIGCGIGQTRQLFPACDYVGIDINDDYLALAAAPRNENTAYAVMDSSHLAFADNSFDIVISVAVFHHLTDEQVIATLDEAKRVCKPGGQVHVIDVLLPLWRWNAMKYLILRADRGRHGRWGDQMLRLVRTRYPDVKMSTAKGPIHDMCHIVIPA